MNISRRHFLKSSAALAAASTLPSWFLAEQESFAAEAKPLSPNDQPAVALVGCGGMGRGDAQNASKYGRIVALCDVDDARLDQSKKIWPDARTYKDFRKVMERDDIHAVICGTVDHWHTLISMAAMKSGKDVYCEKPLTLTIDEGKRLVETSRQTKRILQTGSQQRSEKNFRLACELVRNGRIGHLVSVNVILPAGRREGPFMPSPVPQGFDWDQWLGPTPKVDYVKERAHTTFRYWWDYSGGTMTDWGAHHNDIALWGMGLDRSGPSEIEGKCTVDMIPGGFSACSEYAVTYKYPNGVVHTCESTNADNWSGGVVRRDGQRHGVKFVGKEGWIWVTRGNIQASRPEILTEPLASNAERLYTSDNHMKNFFDCMRSRKQPICDVEIGHRSASICHLGVIAIRTGKKLQWDPKTEKFLGDNAANEWLSRLMRKGYDYSML